VIKYTCRDYDFDCDFEIESEDGIEAIDAFCAHISKEHGKEDFKKDLDEKLD